MFLGFVFKSGVESVSICKLLIAVKEVKRLEIKGRIVNI